MNNYIQLSDAQKQAVLTQCKNMMGLPEQAVEKDYWVTVMLQLIFDSELSEHIIFKGGTSLSKNGNLIERFSEDIDLAVNYEYFGLNDEPTKKHLYDLNRMMDRYFAVAAIQDDALWEHIRHHREKFTSILGVDYSGDIRDRICLVPPEKHIDDWRKDYQYMCDSMIYGEKPTFAELMESMAELERRFRERE